MKFDLLLTKPRRLCWLRWGLVLYPISCLGLIRIGFQPVFWLIIAIPVLVLAQAVFYNKLFRQPAWVQVAPDGVAWANPASSPPVHYQFAELRAYRFEWTKNDIRLLLYPREGVKVAFSGRLHQEFWAMEEAFKQAVRHYNQANPGAEAVQEPDALTKFFTSPRATQVLWGLLALGVLGVGWGISRDAPGVAYLPLLLVELPYLLVWANFYYERP